MGEGETITGPWGRQAPAAIPVTDTDLPAESRAGKVTFLGTSARLTAILLHGYLMTLLTAGIYRFWLVTQKRRFYWSNTLIDGHPLEYTGRSIQLLVGFLLAITVFIPLYGGVFYLTTVFREAAALAYVGLFVVLYFLSGYAAYRGRRFRLTRTLWRGIRFGQTGSAWLYAVLRFFWTLATIVTLGLTYPLMVVSLYKYRFNNTWFGDRKFSFGGRARDFAGTFILVYLVNGVLAGVVVMALVASRADASFLPLALLLATLSLSLPLLRARIETRMLSAIRIGEAGISVRIKARSLYAQYIVFGLLAGGISLVFLMLLGFFLEGLESGALSGLIETVTLFGRGFGTLILFAVAYLAVIATYALFWEIVFHLGYWKLVVREAVITDIDSLRTVRASHEESPNIGEGLADALNVGAY